MSMLNVRPATAEEITAARDMAAKMSGRAPRPGYGAEWRPAGQPARESVSDPAVSAAEPSPRPA